MDQLLYVMQRKRICCPLRVVTARGQHKKLHRTGRFLLRPIPSSAMRVFNSTGMQAHPSHVPSGAREKLDTTPCSLMQTGNRRSRLSTAYSSWCERLRSVTASFSATTAQSNNFVNSYGMTFHHSSEADGSFSLAKRAQSSGQESRTRSPLLLTGANTNVSSLQLSVAH